MPRPKKAGITRSSNSFKYEIFPPKLKTFSDSFFPYFTKKWNELPFNLKNEGDMDEFKSKLKTYVKPKKHKHFNRGSKRGNSILTQLRVGGRHLNVHKFALGLIDN